MTQILVGLPFVAAVLMVITLIGGLARIYIFEDTLDHTPIDAIVCTLVGCVVSAVLFFLATAAFAVGFHFIGA